MFIRTFQCPVVEPERFVPVGICPMLENAFRLEHLAARQEFCARNILTQRNQRLAFQSVLFGSFRFVL
jgi:hypothetical protein